MTIVTAQSKGLVPCTYSTDVIVHVTRHFRDPHPRYYVFNYSQYSIEDSMWAQTGYVPMGSIHSTGAEFFFPPYYDYTIAPVLDHITCGIVPIKHFFNLTDDLCFYFPSNYSCISRGISCPGSGGHGDKLCDMYVGMDERDPNQPPVSVTWYVLVNTFIPVQRIREGIDREVYDFITFDTKKPDPQFFIIPKEILAVCKDMTQGTKMNDNAVSFPSRSDNSLINDDAAIARINAKAKGWKAGRNKVFDGLTLGQFTQKFIGSPISKLRGGLKTFNPANAGRKFVAPNKMSFSNEPIPESFDASKKWPHCGIDSIRTQGQCGSCWAFTSTEVLGDRYCILKNTRRPLKLSPQYPVSCFEDLYGCGGGFLDDVWHNLIHTGTVEDNCFFYNATERVCPRRCDDGSELHMYKAQSVYDLHVDNDLPASVEMIQRDIMANGPVHASFWLFDDFINYNSGVYQRTPGSVLKGGHHVKIYGWGVDKESGLPYWLIANSWGRSWGEKGTVRFLRGSNDCTLEDNLGAGLPLLQ